jgi:hypothetical protein
MSDSKMEAPMWKGVVGLIEEIRRCERAGATIAAVGFAFVCIDTMAFLSLPSGKSTQTRKDFIAWTDKYLKGHQTQPYQYRGIDVYAARCALLHAFGSEADLHDKDKSIIRFCYHDGGKHAYDPKLDSRLAIIGTASFLHDVVIAVEDFMKDCLADRELLLVVEGRLPKVLQTFSFGS